MLTADLGFALLGGALIGLSAVGLLVINGRVAGISGIAGGVISSTIDDKGWRALFLVGLVLGGFTLALMYPQALHAPTQSPGLVLLAGLLVGVGVRMGNGCTSGHGVCGVSRLSPRSIAATATFVAAGMLTATLFHGVTS